MRSRHAALALALAAAAARAEDASPEGGDVHARATLHARATVTANMPGTAVLFDRSTNTFDVGGYLVPEGGERYGSTFASVALDGSFAGGDLRWFLAADTGELRERSVPRGTLVCWRQSGTGLATTLADCDLYQTQLPAGGIVDRYRVFPAEETRLAPSVVTANGRLPDVELRKTLFVREAFAALSMGRAGFATVRAGRRRTAVADGFVYDDYSTGAELALDLGAIGPSWDLSLAVFQPTRDFPDTVSGISPVVAVRVDNLPSLFEHAGGFAAFYRDRTGSVAELFRSAMVERSVMVLSRVPVGDPRYVEAAHRLALVSAGPLGSDATMIWLGTSGSLVPWRGQRLSWTAALLRGEIDKIFPAGAPEISIAEAVPVSGRLAYARWNTSLGERCGAGAFFLYMSGGDFPPPQIGAPSTGRYTGFIGINPYVTATNLFFGGGLSETFAARQATTPGVSGRGVIAPGLELSVDPAQTLGIEAKAAWLRADVAGPYGGRAYGVEADLNVSWSPWRGLVVGVELDALWPGDFYGGRATVYKTILAADLVTP